MSKYRSEDENVIVENPAAGENGEPQVIPPPSAEPEMPPAAPIEPVSDVESTRSAEPDPTVPQQRFRFRSEDDVAAPAEDAASAAPEAPAEAPAAPMDAPAEAPAADAIPADAPAAPEAPAVDVAPADVPAAAPMVEPQPDAEVAPAEGAAPAAAPVAPEVAASPEVGAVEPAPATPEEAPVDNAAPQARFKQEGEEISVVATPEPRAPETTETTECPETGDTCVDKDVNEPINPVVTSEDPITEDTGANADEPIETGTKNDITVLTPEEAESEQEVIDEVSQCMRMEDTSDAEVEAGDQDVNATVNVNVRKDDGDEHADDTADTGAEVSDDGDQNPAQLFKQCGGSNGGKRFKSESGDSADTPAETVADVIDKNDPPIDDAVPELPIDLPGQNEASSDVSGDPDQMFGQWMQEGGSWL